MDPRTVPSHYGHGLQLGLSVTRGSRCAVRSAHVRFSGSWKKALLYCIGARSWFRGVWWDG
jgi:hypothetical protein